MRTRARRGGGPKRWSDKVRELSRVEWNADDVHMESPDE